MHAMCFRFAACSSNDSSFIDMKLGLQLLSPQDIEQELAGALAFGIGKEVCRLANRGAIYQIR